MHGHQRSKPREVVAVYPLEGFRELGRAQGGFVTDERPALQFFETLSGLFDRGVVRVYDDKRTSFKGWPEVVGCRDAEHLYLLPDAVWDAVNATRHLPVDRSTLFRDLRDEGLSVCDSKRTTKTVKLAGKATRCLMIKVGKLRELGIELFADGDEGEQGNVARPGPRPGPGPRTELN